jgi:hypothetical protein
VLRKPSVSMLASVLAPVCLACTSVSDESRRPPPLVIQTTADESVADAQSSTAPIDEVIEIATADLGHDPTAVPVTLAIATPASVPWREVTVSGSGAAEPISELEFVYVASGVVARSSAGIHELDADGRLVLTPGLTLPEGTLVGHWPDDAWSIEAQPVVADGAPHFEYRVLRLDPKAQQWLAQPYHGKARWIGEPLAVRKGWEAGLLIREHSTLTRLGSQKPAPDIGMRMGKLLLDTFESNSGQLYTISERPTGVHVQGDCPDFDCVKSTAKKLPFGTEWSFSIQLPRQRKSLTLATHVDIDGTPVHYLLHFEVGGWKLESLDHAPSGLWSNAEGGVWAKLGEALWYRSPGGEWFEVALPEGASGVTAALLEDASELWIATSLAGQARVYATSAILAEPN